MRYQRSPVQVMPFRGASGQAVFVPRKNIFPDLNFYLPTQRGLLYATGMVMCVRLLGESASCASPFAVCGHDSGYLCVYDLRASSAEPLMESRLHDKPCEKHRPEVRRGNRGAAERRDREGFCSRSRNWSIRFDARSNLPIIEKK